MSTETKWEKLGRILAPDPSIGWMSHFCGPAFVMPLEEHSVRVFMAGRDEHGVSRIGVVDLAIGGQDDAPRVLRVSPQPVLDIGEPACFDENGVSYPG